MTDELTSPGGSATPTPVTPATGTPAPVSATPQVAAPTVEELLREREELKHKYGNAAEELERHRKFRASYDKQQAEAEAAKKAAEEAQLSEIERTNKKYAEMQARHEAAIRELQETKVQHAVLREATGLQFINPEIAVKLLDLSELEYDSNGTPQNTQKLLDKLIKSMPELVRPSQPESTPTPTQPNASANPALRQPIFTPAAPTIPAMNPGRSNIPAPGSNPPGRIPRLSDRGVFVAPGTPSKYQP